VAAVRAFKSRWFDRFARKHKIPDWVLLDAVQRADEGQIDADLGGGVIKQRIARPGQGKSGEYRVIVFYRKQHRAVFMYGFPKSQRDDIRPDEKKQFREAAKHVLTVSDKQVQALIESGDFVEVRET
jgi:hypothetical protein